MTDAVTNRGGLRLKTCDVRQCEARCCYDGVYLLPAEEQFLLELVAAVPPLQARLPAQFVVDGYWDGKFAGRKTAVRSQEYLAADYPAHFARTRCVFADALGFCELEKLARSNGQHPWTYKPTTCWMFPLQDDAGEVAPPVRGAHDDPYHCDAYPGYATCVPCGRHDAAGQPWRMALAREIQYLEAAPQLPLLGSPGHTVSELLRAAGKKNPAE
jgi:hypothetical protein